MVPGKQPICVSAAARNEKPAGGGFFRHPAAPDAAELDQGLLDLRFLVGHVLAGLRVELLDLELLRVESALFLVVV